MPLKTWSTKADYDGIYYARLEPDGHPASRPAVVVNYCRWLDYPWHQTAATNLISILGLQPTQRIVLVGSGFAWTLEALVLEHGFDPARVVGVDTSAYVHSAKATSEEADIRAAISAVGLDPNTGRGAELLARAWDGGARVRAGIRIINETLTNNASRRRTRDAVGQPIDWVISEVMLESLTDNEAILASQNVHAIDAPTTGVAHIVTTQHSGTDRYGNPVSFNLKSLAAWKALLPADRFIDALTWEQVL